MKLIITIAAGGYMDDLYLQAWRSIAETDRGKSMGLQSFLALENILVTMFQVSNKYIEDWRVYLYQTHVFMLSNVFSSHIMPRSEYLQKQNATVPFSPFHRHRM